MKRIYASIVVVITALTGCTTGSITPSLPMAGLRPIPGSITYGGQPRTKLTKAPIGSIVPNRFTDSTGRQVEENYIIQPDRSLKLVSRRYRPFFAFDDR